MTGDQMRRETALALLSMRKMRGQIFPAEIFDEHAWTMLLQLFVSLTANETMTEERLISTSEVGLKTGRAWIKHLVADDQVEARSDGDDVILTPKSIDRMREFLDTAPIEPRERSGNADNSGSANRSE